MLSEKDKKNLDIIKNVVNLANSKINDSQFIHNTFSDLMVLFHHKHFFFFLVLIYGKYLLILT